MGILKGIEIIFENCEVVSIPAKCIKDIKLVGSMTVITSGKIALTNIDKITTSYENNVKFRLQQHDDITCIRYLCEDEKDNYEVRIDWQDEDEDGWSFGEENKHQTSELIDDTLYITFSESEVSKPIKEVTLTSETYDSIMRITNDFVMANIMPKHNVINIHTSNCGDEWKSEIKYK